MTSKYLAWVCTVAVIAGACSAPPPTVSPSATLPPIPAASASVATTPRGLPGALAADVRSQRRWHTTTDDVATIVADFSVDPRAGDPRVRLADGRTVPMTFTAGGPRGFGAAGSVPLAGLPPGEHRVEVVVRLQNGSDAAVGSAAFLVSAPEYVVWTLDFEGDAANDETMANTAAIADGLAVPMTLMWNPRVWTTTAVSAQRADAMLAWTKGRAAKGDEVALHLHMYTDLVRAAGVAPRSQPTWSGRLDGYDVPMTVYAETDIAKMLELSLRLMQERGLARPISFRAGGLIADAAVLRAVAAAGFTADCSATGAGTFGALRLPWTLAPDAQPYMPSRDDADRAGDLALLEAPTNGGNTYGYTSASIAPIARADLAMLAKPGEVATARKAITIVSHPGTIDATERAAIETLLHAFDPFRYDQDKGPLRFVTLQQLAKLWK